MRSYVGRGAGAHIENKLLSAQQYVLVCSPWISPFYAQKLVDLAKRGVVVKLITSNSDVREHQEALKIIKNALKPERDWLGRVKKDWQPPSIDVKIIDERFVHAKIYAIDGNYAVVGSANLTEHGMWKNVEHLIIFDDETSVEQIENDFALLWQTYAGKEIIEELTSKIPKILRPFEKLLKFKR